MVEEEKEKIKPEGTPLTQTQLDAIADINLSDLAEAEREFDERNPHLKGLLRCRQVPRQFN